MKTTWLKPFNTDLHFKMNSESNYPFTIKHVIKGVGLSALATLLLLIGVVYFKNAPSQNPISMIFNNDQEVLVSEAEPESIQVDSQENSQVQGATFEPTENDTLRVDVFQLYLLVNAYRKEQRLSPLLNNPLLEESARLKVEDMIENKYFRHQDVQGGESWYLFSQVGYSYRFAGENLSFGHQTTWQIFSDWLSSPDHAAQLSNPNYSHMGFYADCQSFEAYPDGGCVATLHLGAD